MPNQRQENYNQRKKIETEIEVLRKRLAELEMENLLLSDETQWFTEKEEEHIITRRPKKTEKFLVGRINWSETLKDEDGGDSVVIERSKVVRINGKWTI